MAEGHEGPEYIPTPEERQRNRERARGRSPAGAPGSGNWWRRRSTGAKIALIVVAVLIALAALGALLDATNSDPVTATEAQSTATPKLVVKTPAQKKAEARARARARAARIAKAKPERQPAVSELQQQRTQQPLQRRIAGIGATTSKTATFFGSGVTD